MQRWNQKGGNGRHSSGKKQQ